MGRTVIAENGLFFVEGKRKRRVKKRFVLARLRDACEIEEGVTLLDIFRIVDRYRSLKTFVAQYSWCRDIDAFHAQAEEPYAPDSEPLTYLEVYWSPQVHKYSVTKKHPGGTRERTITVDFEVAAEFHGVRPRLPEEQFCNRNDGMMNVSVSYCPVWDIAHAPLRLNKEFVVHTPFEPSKRPDKLLESKREFSLLEVLDAIYFDISFVGGPAEKVEFLEDLHRRKDEALTDHDDLKNELGL